MAEQACARALGYSTAGEWALRDSPAAWARQAQAVRGKAWGEPSAEERAAATLGCLAPGRHRRELQERCDRGVGQGR